MRGKRVYIKEMIHEYIISHKDDILNDLKEFIKIPSVRGEADGECTYGKNCAEALKFAKRLYEKNGFETELNQKGGYLLSYFGEGDKTLGIFSHADVVAASDDWILTTPFEPIEKNGFLVGRGSLDDKPGVIVSLYCMKMIKELNIQLKSRLLCFSGANEETGMGDIQNFLSEHEKPDFSLVPDSAFPIFRGNKGRLVFSIKSDCKLPNGFFISGGTGATIIGEAIAQIPYNQSLFDEISKHCNERISIEGDDGDIYIKAKGIAKHSALPEGSLSAVSLIAGVLKESEVLSQPEKTLFENFYNMASSNYGEYFGIEAEDEEFGKLTCVMTKIKTEEDGRLTVDFNIRYGDSTNKEYIVGKITEKSEKINWSEVKVGGFSLPNILSKDNIFVENLMDVYKEFTGCKTVESYVNAGGTYRQYLKDAVEVGTTNRWGVPEGLPPGHGGAHQPDECINIEGFLEAIEIIILMILECDRILENMR